MKNHRFNIVSVILGFLLISVGYGCSYSTGASTDKEDADGDGYCLGAVDCKTSSLIKGDCNDNNHLINPSTVEVAGDSVDNDCDGSVDEEEANQTEDADDDDDGYTELQGDCDDTNPSVYHGATEICDNGIDEDCDGNDCETECADCDPPAPGPEPLPEPETDEDGDGYTADVDCDDTNPAINVKTSFYFDTDADSFGDPSRTIELCEVFSGYSVNNTDCDDSNATTYPGAVEINDNGIDEDCDGVDSTSPSTPAPWYTYYRDADQDGYGRTNFRHMTRQSTPPSGYVSQDGDCNDSNSQINPGVEEIDNNSVDEDCDGIVAQEPSGDCDDPGSFSTPDAWEANCGEDPAPSPANPLDAEYDALDDFITDHGVEMAQGIRALWFPETSNDDVLGLRTLVSQLKTATSASQKNSRIQNHFNGLGNAERDDVASLFVILLGAVAPNAADDLISNNTIKSTFNSLIHDGAPVAFGTNEYIDNIAVAIAFGFLPPPPVTGAMAWSTSCTVLWRYNH